MLLAWYIVLLWAKSNGGIDYELKSIALSHSLKMQPTVAEEVRPEEQEAAGHIASAVWKHRVMAAGAYFLL